MDNRSMGGWTNASTGFGDAPFIPPAVSSGWSNAAISGIDTSPNISIPSVSNAFLGTWISTDKTGSSSQSYGVSVPVVSVSTGISRDVKSGSSPQTFGSSSDISSSTVRDVKSGSSGVSGVSSVTQDDTHGIMLNPNFRWFGKAGDFPSSPNVQWIEDPNHAPDGMILNPKWSIGGTGRAGETSPTVDKWIEDPNYAPEGMIVNPEWMIYNRGYFGRAGDIAPKQPLRWIKKNKGEDVLNRGFSRRSNHRRKHKTNKNIVG